MAHTQVLRIKKLTGGGIILAAARHNLREIQAELGADSHINPLKTSQNVILRGAERASEIAAQASAMMEQVKRRRKDQVLGIEVLISLPSNHGIDELVFFSDSVNWAQGFFELTILSAIIHHDEENPHCHIIMHPLFHGRMRGSRLVDKPHLKAMHADFFDKVGRRYGLTRQANPKRFSNAYRLRTANRVTDYLRRNPKSLNEPTILDALRDTITRAENPALLAAALGLEVT